MAVAFRSATSKSSKDATGVGFLQKPSGTVEGDFLLAAIVGRPGNALSPPSGWTQIETDTQGNFAGALYWKIAGASEPANWSWGTSSTGDYSGIVLCYSGVDTANPIDVSGKGETTGNTATAPSLTTTAARRVVAGFGFAAVTSSGQVSTVATPSGTTSRAACDNDAGLDAMLRLVDFDTSAAGATGAVAAAMTSAATADANIGWQVALKAPNAAPNAPTLTAPADGTTIDRNATQRFDWDFSDPDAGDSQSAYDLRYRVVGAGTWTDVTGTTPNTFHDFAAATFAAGDYEWQVRTYDAQGVVGPYSGSSFFTAATAPAEPTITDPVSGGTIASEDATVTWSAPDQDAYQVRKVADNAGTPDTTTVYYDTGEVASTTARTATLTFPTNNRYEHLQVRIKDGGLWSSWASVRVLVSYTPPPTPVVSLLADDEAGSLVVTITNPTPGAGEPAVSYNNVYIDDGDGEERRATLVPPNSSWTYWTPKSGRDYAGSVRVTAVGDNGTSASS